MKRISRYILSRFPLKLLVLFVLFLLVGYAFGITVHEAFGEKDDAMDKRVFNFISVHLENDQLTKIMRTVTFFASAKYLVVAYILLVLYFLIIRKNNVLGLDIAAIAITSFLIMTSFKRIFQRVRPLDPLIEPLENYSYPSGHASLGFIFYGLLAYLIWQSKLRSRYKWMAAISLIVFSLVIGFSRIYLRIHFPSDVIAGICLGISWLSLSIWFLKRTDE